MFGPRLSHGPLVACWSSRSIWSSSACRSGIHVPFLERAILGIRLSFGLSSMGADELFPASVGLELVDILDTLLESMDWIALGTLAAALLTLSWSIRSRQSPVWSLGSADGYIRQSEDRKDDVCGTSITALQRAGYRDFLQTHDDRQFFMLY